MGATHGCNRLLARKYHPDKVTTVMCHVHSHLPCSAIDHSACMFCSMHCLRVLSVAVHVYTHDTRVQNPEGRDMFEKVQQAYEMLAAARPSTVGPDPVNVKLIIKTQVGER